MFHLTLLFIATHTEYLYVHISEFKMRTDISGYSNVQESVYEYTGSIVVGHVRVLGMCVYTDIMYTQLSITFQTGLCSLYGQCM